MPVINRSKQTWVVSKVKKADSLLSRIIGWIGTALMDPEAGLWVKPCWGIHTFGMKFAVDVLFLERNNNVVKMISSLPRNRISPFSIQARSVLVLPAHSISKSRTAIGDRIDIS